MIETTTSDDDNDDDWRAERETRACCWLVGEREGDSHSGGQNNYSIVAARMASETESRVRYKTVN